MDQTHNRRNDDKPNIAQLQAELHRINDRSKFRKILRSTFYTLVIVAALALLIAVLFMPVLRIYGSAMKPTLDEGEIVVSVKNAKIRQGDVVAVYLGSRVLVKRCIATAGQSVEVDRNGDVYVDGKKLDEPYVIQKAFGKCDIEMPYLVPENTIFVMGDNRESSIDSRNVSVGCIETEDVIGKILLRVWPLKKISLFR